MFVQADGRKVFAECSWLCKTRMLADEFYPRLVMLERIVMDGLIDAAMDASISLLIANDPQPAHFNRAGQ